MWRYFIICNLDCVNLFVFRRTPHATTLFYEKDKFDFAPTVLHLTLRHSPWMIYSNESHTARIRFASSRWCGIRFDWFTLMSHIQLESASLLLADAAFAALNKKNRICLESKLSPNSVLFVYVTHCLRTKEKYQPRQFNAQTGTRVRLQGLEPCTPWKP